MWSKTKKQLENFLADKLKNRLEYKVNVKNSGGIISIMFDNKPIFTFYEYCHAWYSHHMDGMYNNYDFLDAAHEYLYQGIRKSLESNNKLVVSLAVLDKRVGKKTLQKLSYLYFTDPNSIVTKAYNLRFSVEFEGK
jgi:hypothetical protein